MNDVWSWHRSSFSDAAGNQCVEVAWTGSSGVLVRDSKDATTSMLAFSQRSWRLFLASGMRDAATARE
ncbi:DUF397 domain-containing protein [Streptomyces sp. AHU1]|uniref:DUF397 domain-containing protein n=1 Tax=Streptomyces sp. AHU1 TaxID=3377215 RepID=UPI0038784056